MMFLLWIMPLIDLAAMAIMLSYHFGIVPWRVLFPFSMYLFIKGIAFRDIASIIDLIIGAYILGMIVFGFHTWLVYLFSLYLLQKALISFR